MNKSDTNAFLLIVTSIVAIITLSHFFEKKPERSFSKKIKENGLKTDRENFAKDYSNIASDMKKAEKNLLNVF